MVCICFGLFGLVYGLLQPGGWHETREHQTRQELIEDQNGGDESAPKLASVQKQKSNALILIRIFKQEAVLEIWRKSGERYVPLNSFDLCSNNLKIGPKKIAEDGHQPEGFYHISAELIRWHWSVRPSALNLGYPNSYDLARSKTKVLALIHSKCEASDGFALGQPQLEELFEIIKTALSAGQSKLPVHIYPFRMTWSEMKSRKHNRNYPFWLNLKEVYNHFEKHKTLPMVFVCGQRYWIAAHGSKVPDTEKTGGTCLPLEAAEDITYQTASKHAWLLAALKTQNLASWTSPRMMKKIKVRCNLKRPSCKRWLSLRKKMLADGKIPPELMKKEKLKTGPQTSPAPE